MTQFCKRCATPVEVPDSGKTSCTTCNGKQFADVQPELCLDEPSVPWELTDQDKKQLFRFGIGTE